MVIKLDIHTDRQTGRHTYIQTDRQVRRGRLQERKKRINIPENIIQVDSMDEVVSRSVSSFLNVYTCDLFIDFVL